MSEDKSALGNEKEKEVSIIEGWAHISEYRFNGLSEQEKAQFDKAQFAEEQAEKTNFVLGEPIKRSY